MRTSTALALLALLTLSALGCSSSSTTTAAAPPAAPPAPAAPAVMAIDQGVDRPGEDFKDFDLDDPRPEVCRDACQAEAACLAFTFVKAGVQGDKARCWLKNKVPEATPSDCCASGVRR